MTYFRRFGTLTLLAVTSLLASAAAQQSSTPPTQPKPDAGQQTQPANPPAPSPSSSTDKNAENPGIKNQEKTGTSNDRLFFALPNFLTVEAKDVPPLTAGQKFKVVARGAFDPIQIPWYAIQAGISQAANSEPGYGQGAEGYGKRFGSAFGIGVASDTARFALAEALKEDTFYYRCACKGFLPRLKHAVISTLTARRGEDGTSARLRCAP